MVFTDFLKNSLLYILFTCVILSKASAQISPPGMGDGKAASWLAVGVRQDLDQAKSWQSLSYIGLGRKSSPNSSNLLQKPSIMVFNQEFYHPFAKSWQTSVAVSYRRQNQYETEAPYAESNPGIQQEFRLYGRLSKNFQIDRFTLTPTIRQEIRRFYTPEFNNPDEPLQLRSRFRVQVSRYLDQKKEHKLMLSSEQLFTTGRSNSTGSWSTFAYAESRFMLYYSYSPPSLPVTFDLGYMNNLLGKKSPTTIHYLAFDVIVKNPFGKKK